MDLPKTFDEFVDARKQGFIRAKEFKDNGGKTGWLPLFLYTTGTVRCSRCCNGRTLRNQQ